MKKAKYVSLGLIAVLSCYLLATAVFVRFLDARAGLNLPTRTPGPTFTASPAPAVAVVPVAPPTVSPAQVSPTPTLRPSPTPTPTPTASPTLTPVPAPQILAPGGVNLRSGPGTNYPVIGGLQANSRASITGRNADGSWWQIQTDDGQAGWVANSVVEASHTEGVAVAAAPPPPPPTPTPLPPPPEQPRYQYEPTGWFDDTNYGLTRFLGTISDVNGNPVDGVYVEASCGAFRVLSNASGTTGWPPGFYDIVLARHPVPCDWGLAVVSSDDGKTATGRLSDLMTITITVDKSIVTANWRKNW